MIHGKQTKSERVSDTVFFKTKYITQPTLTHADLISKALNNLTQALKGKSNKQELEQIKALKRLDIILNNKPEPTLATVDARTHQRVTFDEAANAPAETEPREATPTPRVAEQPQGTRTEPIHPATIEKTIPKAPTPRVCNKAPKRMEMRERIQKHIKATMMARIPRQSMYLR